MRRFFALAVVVLHVLVLALFMSGVAPRLNPEPDLPVFISLWVAPVEPAPPVQILEPPPPAPTRAPTGASRIPARVDAPAVTESAPVESTAITVPAPDVAPAASPPVDWAQAGKLAARRAGERAQELQQLTFSPPPKTVPKPCVPKKSSMEWNGEEDRPVTWAGPIPVVKVGKRCVWALVFFACNLSEIPEANSHLLDDMRAADRPRSSVPDPNICD